MRIEDTWHTLGMRATGSHDIVLDGVVVPEGTVSLRRPKGEWHAFFNVVCASALPLIMAVYLGVAEAASGPGPRSRAQKPDDPALPYLLGEMDGALVTAQMAVQSMIDLHQEYAFASIVQTAEAILSRKTIAARACVATVEKALEVVGGRVLPPLWPRAARSATSTGRPSTRSPRSPSTASPGASPWGLIPSGKRVRRDRVCREKRRDGVASDPV